MILARWSYSKDEWSSFLFRHYRKRSLLRSLASRAGFLPPVPEVVFTPTAVLIGNKRVDLGETAPIREVNLYEEGSVNVMRLVFEKLEVPIPIPKGKLREALELRDRLRNGGS